MKQYYIISLKHTSKGDTALTFWCANGAGYTYSRNRAGKYTAEEAKKCILGSIDNVMVECEKVDPFWMNAVDYNDKFIAVANTPAVRKAIGITDKHMKPKKWATCKMAFMNTPVTPVTTLLLVLLLFVSCSPSRMITPCPGSVTKFGDTVPSKILISAEPPAFGHSIDGYCIYKKDSCTGHHLKWWHKRWIVVGPEYTVWKCIRRGSNEQR